MIILLSPAKSLDLKSPVPKVRATQPRFLPQANALAQAAARLDSADLMALMRISEPLAALNEARFKAFSPPFTTDNARPALFTFDGDVYSGLDARSLDAEDLTYAQGHLRILSGLYGLLRPLDLMQPYRLEMGTSFGTDEARNLYEYWRARIASALAEDLDKERPLIINLASDEYFKAVDMKALKAQLLTIDFRDRKGSKLRFNSFIAKRARGAAARAIIKGRMTSPEPLKTISILDHRFEAGASDENHWLFVRVQD